MSQGLQEARALRLRRLAGGRPCRTRHAHAPCTKYPVPCSLYPVAGGDGRLTQESAPITSCVQEVGIWGILAHNTFKTKPTGQLLRGCVCCIVKRIQVMLERRSFPERIVAECWLSKGNNAFLGLSPCTPRLLNSPSTNICNGDDGTKPADAQLVWEYLYREHRTCREAANLDNCCPPSTVSTTDQAAIQGLFSSPRSMPLLFSFGRDASRSFFPINSPASVLIALWCRRVHACPLSEAPTQVVAPRWE